MVHIESNQDFNGFTLKIGSVLLMDVHFICGIVTK